MKIPQICAGWALLILMSTAAAGDQVREQSSYRPARGYVPDKETALTIAIAVLTPIYGKELIESEKPYLVVEKKGVWIINGATPTSPGGSAEIRISRKTGQILFLMHYK